MSPELIEVARQLPVVAIFIFFVIYWSGKTAESQDKRDLANQNSQDKRDELMRNFWKEQQEQLRRVLDDVCARLSDLNQMMDSHDQKTDQAIAVMKERTRPARKAKE